MEESLRTGQIADGGAAVPGGGSCRSHRRTRGGDGGAWDRAAQMVVALRAVAEATAAAAAASEPATARPTPPALPRAGRCPHIVRQELAKSLPEICRALTEKVLGGDLAALKQLWTMAELDDRQAEGTATRRDSSFARKTAAFHAR